MYGLRQPKPQVAQAQSLPACTGGLNDLDPLATMEASFMLDCMNFFPDTGALKVRDGYAEWVTGFGAPVKTIMSYNAVDGSFAPFAATDNGIYDISVSTILPVFDIAVTNGTIEWTNFATAAGQFLVAVNGSQALFYNGTTWGAFTEVLTPAAPGEIHGVDPATFNFVLPHKGRLWFLVPDSMTAWYLPIDSLGGEAKPFFLGGLFKRGGYLIALARWSADTGDGLDDRIVFISSNGELASYSGNDPASADDWNLDAIFFIAPSLGPRAITDFGGDVIYLSRRGLIPLSTLVQGNVTEIFYSNVMSRRISRTLIDLTRATNPPFPVEVGFHSELALIAINVYDDIQQKPIQLVMNFLTGAWGRFDFPVRTIRTVNRTTLMGTDDGRVLLMTNGQNVDNVLIDGSGGVPIEAYSFSAYTFLGDTTTLKHAKFIRPIIQSEVKPSFVTRVLPDFRLDKFTLSPVPNTAQGNALWDTSQWDQANWGGVENIYRPWISANVLGYSFAWQIKVSTSAPLAIAGVQWIWESGGLI